VHIGKDALLRCFHRSSWTDVYQTFSRYRTGYTLYNNVPKLRRFV